MNYFWKLNLLYLGEVNYNSISLKIETYFTLTRWGRL